LIVPHLDPVGWIIVGFLAGWLSGAVVDRGGPTGCLPNIAVGIIVGLFGGWFATEELHMSGPTTWLGALVVASLGAVAVRLVLEAMEGGDGRGRRGGRGQ
jgi:uncharacterized membrane protein YeaQ/YmgE (transglycosylase-associated protein family)